MVVNRIKVRKTNLGNIVQVVVSADLSKDRKVGEQTED
jgi:hypothetical protein